MENVEIFNEYFLIRLITNFGGMILMIGVVYHSVYNKREFYFSFYLLNFVVFLLSYMLEKTNAFGGLSGAFLLLAAFTLLRFRTETISAKDMTYLFLSMTLGLVNAILKGTVIEVIALNLIIVGMVFLVDGNKIFKNEKVRTIDYEGLENIKPEQRELLINDLKQKTGLNIYKIIIERIDFSRGSMRIKIFYNSDRSSH